MVLKSPQCDRFEKSVAYFSKEAPIYWRHWLLSNEFIVFSDHKPFGDLVVNVHWDEELGDMMTFLSQFDFKIVFNPGQNSGEADGLPWNPVLEADFETHKNIIRTSNLGAPTARVVREG